MNKYNINGSWKKIKIKEFTTVITGGTPSTRNKDYWENGNIPWLPSGDLKNTLIHKSSKFITQKGLDNSVAKIMPKGTVVIALTGATTGKVGLLEIKAAANQSVTGILPSEAHIPKYLFYYLRWIRPKILDKCYGGGQPHISQKFVKNIKVPLPSIENQIKIVNIIENAEELISYKNDSHKLIHDFNMSIFLKMFGDPILNPKGWKTKKLSELGVWKSGGTPSRKNKKYFEGDIPWYTAGELTSIFIKESRESITDEAIEKSSAKIIPENSILLGMYDTAALKSSITTNPCSCNQAIAYSCLENSIVDIIFLYYAIQIGKNYLKRMQRGVRQKNLNLTMIRNLKVPIPDFYIQKKFSRMIYQMEELKKKQKESNREIKKINDALNQKMLNGVLDE